MIRQVPRIDIYGGCDSGYANGYAYAAVAVTFTVTVNVTTYAYAAVAVALYILNVNKSYISYLQQARQLTNVYVKLSKHWQHQQITQLESEYPASSLWN